MSIIVANDIPFTESQLDPLTSIENVLAFDARDWSTRRGDAWLYGIVFGWGIVAMSEVAPRHGWDAIAVDRLRRLHLAYRRMVVHRKSDVSERLS